MIDGRRVLAVIPARGGSKGIVGKNLHPLGGRPLIEWTIRAGRASRHVDRMLVSSDDGAIRNAAIAAGCESPFARPHELATDDAASIDVIRHAMAWVEAQEGRPYHYLVLLQPTSPLRTAGDIDACIEACHETGVPTVVSVTQPAEPPYWMYRKQVGGRLDPLLPMAGPSRRQDLPETYVVNGAVYVMRWDFPPGADSLIVSDTRAVDMPRERSIDIDTPFDLVLAEALLAATGAAAAVGGS